MYWSSILQESNVRESPISHGEAVGGKCATRASSIHRRECGSRLLFPRMFRRFIIVQYFARQCEIDNFTNEG